MGDYKKERFATGVPLQGQKTRHNIIYSLNIIFNEGIKTLLKLLLNILVNIIIVINSLAKVSTVHEIIGCLTLSSLLSEFLSAERQRSRTDMCSTAAEIHT